MLVSLSFWVAALLVLMFIHSFWNFFFIVISPKRYKCTHIHTHTTVIQMIIDVSYGLLSFRTVNSLNKVLTEMESRNNCFIALFEAGPSIRLPRVLKWMCTMCGWGWDLVMGIWEKKSLCVWTAWSSALDLNYIKFFFRGVHRHSKSLSFNLTY